MGRSTFSFACTPASPGTICSCNCATRNLYGQSVIKVNLTATFSSGYVRGQAMMRKRFGRIIAIKSIVGVSPAIRGDRAITRGSEGRY